MTVLTWWREYGGGRVTARPFLDLRGERKAEPNMLQTLQSVVNKPEWPVAGMSR
jgi:hypothetical protein